MKYQTIKSALWSIGLALMVSGCEVFGLEFQEPYDFDYDAGIPSNKVNMSTWDFIQSRSDLFSLLKEAIEYTGLQSEFQQSGCTYLLPTNAAFNSEDETEKSYFQLHQLSYFDTEIGEEVSYAPISMTSYPKEQVKEFLLYHIVKGLYTHTNLPAEPTWYETCASADTAQINMYILKDRNPNITFNNFDGHYKSEIKPRTSNLFSSDGSYIHVIESWMDRPTRAQLNIQ